MVMELGQRSNGEVIGDQRSAKPEYVLSFPRAPRPLGQKVANVES